MQTQWFGKNILAVLALSVFLTGGCGGGGGGGGSASDPRGQIIAHKEAVKYNTHEEIGVFLDNLDTSAQDPLQSMWDTFKAYFRYPVVMVSMDYFSRNASGDTIRLSGMVALPWHWEAAKRQPVPILALQHPTEVERRYSPSKLNILDPQLTVPVALAMAATGYAVAVTDYAGMGENFDVHPYCHQSLSYSVVDMVRAARTYVVQHPQDMLNTWDGRLFLTGYSEGAYASMVAAKELQQNHATEFFVAAVATLDGPYALSGTMRQVMINADAAYMSPYFLPYVLSGYEAVYGSSVPEFAFRRNVRNDVPGFPDYPGALLAAMDGSHTAAEISALMMQVPGYAGPSSILTAPFSADLQNTASTVCRALASNDAYAGWTPKLPTRIKMFHCISDDLVPVGNLDDALAAFQNAGALQVESEKFAEYLPIKPIHAGALPVAYIKGFLWFDAIAYPDRH